MTITTFANPDESPSVPDGPELERQAGSTVSGWLHDDPAVASELKEAMRAHTHFLETKRRADDEASAAGAAEDRAATVMAKHDPAGHRVLGLVPGGALVVLLIGLDGIPLNWAAQAFGLDTAGSWLVTGILVAASVGAMAGFELTRGDARRRAVLSALAAAAYLVLVILRTEFLITVSGASLAGALLQSALLSVISAGLVLCGSAVMARTRTLSLDRARAAARRARRGAVAAQAAARRAGDKLQRHLGSLRQLLVPWALRSPAPEGADHARWAAALDQALRAIFPEQ